MKWGTNKGGILRPLILSYSFPHWAHNNKYYTFKTKIKFTGYFEVIKNVEFKICSFLFVALLVHNNFPQPLRSTIGWVSEKSKESPLILPFSLLKYIPLSKFYLYNVRFYSSIWNFIILITATSCTIAGNWTMKNIPNKWKLWHVEREVSEICVQICFVTNNVTLVTAL
jgi:hypothetical protein